MNLHQQKELADQSRLLRNWRSWRHARVMSLLDGPHGDATRALLEVCKNMPTASTLIAHVKEGGWQTADSDTRHEILSLIDAAIIRHREQKGLAPFDDPLFGQPDNAFLILREALGE